MADFYKRKDVQALLKHRKILFIGDSNVRPLYKDLIAALTSKGLINVDTLKNPDVESYCGDIAIQQCGKKNEWTFWENRIFEEGPWRVEMFCTGRIMLTEIREYVNKLLEVPLSVPDVVYVSFNFFYGKNTHSLISPLLLCLKTCMPCNTLVVVGSGFPTTKDMFGDPRFDEVPFFTRSREDEAEDVRSRVSCIGFRYMNLARYLRNTVFRGMTTAAGWESVIVRYTTFLLLTHIADSLLLKTPKRVNQDVLSRALTSCNNEIEEYNNLLLKHANDWNCVKSNVLIEETDQAANNAFEVTQLLWKVHNRSCDHSSTDEGSIKGIYPGNRLTKKKNAGKCKSATNALCPPEQKLAEVDESGAVIIRNSVESPKESLPAAEESLGIKTSSAEARRDEPLDDLESLEDGEIRDSSSGSLRMNDLYSDVSSSEDEADSAGIPLDPPGTASRTILPIDASYNQFYHHNPSPYHGHQNYPSPNFHIEPLACSEAQRQIQNLEISAAQPMDPIELSDDDPIPAEENPEKERDKAFEAVICVDSDDGELVAADVVLVDRSSQLSKRNEDGEKPPEDKKRKERRRRHGGKDELCLLGPDGCIVSWPKGAVSSRRENLWKWWRKYIEGNNGSIVIYHQSIGRIHGLIPSLTTTKTNVVVPKIVDDINQFLNTLEKITIPESCPYLAVGSKVKSSKMNSNDEPVKTKKLLSLAEELSRGSVKKINFEICKRKPSFLATSNRITIKEFASIRHLTSKSAHKSDSDIRSEPRACSSSNYYSYGEPASYGSKRSSGKYLEPSHPHWITLSEVPGSRECDDKFTRKSIDFRLKPVGTKSPSRAVVARKRENPLSLREEAVVQSSSCSSDRSMYLDRWQIERHRLEDESSSSQFRQREWSPEAPYHFKSASSDSSHSQDSVPRRSTKPSRCYR